MAKFLDNNGLLYFWSKIKAKLDGKADSGHTHSEYLPLAGGTMTGELIVNGSDAVGSSKFVLSTGRGQITNSATQTLFGFLDSSQVAVGHGSYQTIIRGNSSRLTYNGKSVALLSDIPTDTNTTYALSKSGSTITLTGSDGSTTSVTDDVSSGGDGNYLPLTGGTMPGNIIINNSNPHLGLQDTTGSIAYFQTYDDGSGLKAGFGYGWANSLKLDSSGNMSVVGSISEGGTALSNKYAPKTKKVSITLSASSWTATTEGYQQTVTVSGGTANSMIALQPTTAQIVALQDDGVTALVVDNDNGTFIAKAVGAKPSADMTIQATVTEVTS